MKWLNAAFDGLVQIEPNDGSSAGSSPTASLTMLQEISEETGVPVSELRLGRENLERALMARLMEGDVSSEWPLHYLMASYNRLSEDLRSLTTIRDQNELSRMTSTLIYGKQLTVSYSGLLLNMDMFPQVFSSVHAEACCTVLHHLQTITHLHDMLHCCDAEVCDKSHSDA